MIQSCASTIPANLWNDFKRVCIIKLPQTWQSQLGELQTVECPTLLEHLCGHFVILIHSKDPFLHAGYIFSGRITEQHQLEQGIAVLGEFAHPKCFLQGSINIGDIADAKSNGVSVHALILKGQLLCIPNNPAEAPTCPTKQACMSSDVLTAHGFIKIQMLITLLSKIGQEER